MGVYKYFLRKAGFKVSIHGVVEHVHAFSFGFKYHYNPEDERRQRMMNGKQASIWEGVALPRFCYVGDVPSQIRKDAKPGVGELHTLYVNPTAYGWDDCNNFPGRLVGGIEVTDGKARYLPAREYLIEEEERWLKCMMDKEGRGAALARERLRLLRETVPVANGLVYADSIRKMLIEESNKNVPEAAPVAQ